MRSDQSDDKRICPTAAQKVEWSGVEQGSGIGIHIVPYVPTLEVWEFILEKYQFPCDSAYLF